MRDIHTHSIEERCVIFARHLIEHRATVRSAAAYFGISKSTVHKDVTYVLKRVDPALFAECSKILEQNKSELHIRGGEATKKKYARDTTCQN